MHDAYRDRIVATEDFQDNFAMVDVFVSAVGRSEACEAAVEWCASAAPLQRAAGLDVLCVLRADEAAAAALRTAAAEVNPDDACEDLRWSAAHGLACVADSGAAKPLLRFSSDPDGDVRWQVAVGLGYAVATMADDDEGLLGLRQLAQDPDADVRTRAERSLREARARLRASPSGG